MASKIIAFNTKLLDKKSSESLDSVTSVVLPKRRRVTVPRGQEEKEENQTMLGVLIFTGATMLWISGLGMIGFTVYLLASQSDITLVPNPRVYLVSLVLQTVAGISATTTAWFLSCCHNSEGPAVSCNAKGGIVSLLLALSLLIAEVVVLEVVGPNALTPLRERLLALFHSYNYNIESKQAVDYIQKQLHCCGLDKPSDWDETVGGLPASCCQLFEENNCLKWNDSGCYDEHLKRWSITERFVIGGASSLMFLLVLSLPVLVCLALKSKRRQVPKDSSRSSNQASSRNTSSGDNYRSSQLCRGSCSSSLCTG